jgi:phospholipid N-methyltransferase
LVLRAGIHKDNFPGVSLHFIKAMIRSPGSVGALWPSSPFLAKAMVRASSIENADHVLELGPGTGAFTGEILSSLRQGASFSALEIDPELAKTMSKRFPRAKVIAGCATKLGEHLATENVAPPDAILSGLPWTVFDEGLQTNILSQIHTVLRDGGVFSTFAYFGPHRLKGGQAFRRKLENTFGIVKRSPVVIRNFPPAFIYTCRR